MPVFDGRSIFLHKNKKVEGHMSSKKSPRSSLLARYPLQILAAAFVTASCVITLALYPADPQRANAVYEIESQSDGHPLKPQQIAAINHLPPSAAGVESLPVVEQQEQLPWNPEAYAHSLRDTDIDGKLTVDENGNLIFALEVKDFFDYFLSAVGEVSLDEAIAQISHQAGLRLPSNAVEQVMTLLESYIAYQYAMQDTMNVPLLDEKKNDYKYYSEVMASTFEEIKQLRRTYFSPEAADAFFAMEERFSEYSVKAMQIRANTELSEPEKQQKITALEALMPEQMKVAQEEARITAELAQRARAMYEQGMNETEITSLLSQQYEKDTVDEMLDFYKREEAWKVRVGEFMSLKAHVEQASLAEDERQMQLQALREQYFTKDEIARLVSHEAIIRKQKTPKG